MAAYETMTPDQRGKALYDAVFYRNLEVVNKLLGMETNVNFVPNTIVLGVTTPLIMAVKKGSTAIVERLLAAGANIEALDIYRNTPLIIAVEGGYTAIVERLLAAGANVEALDMYRNTPIITAAYKGYTAIVERLFAAGANVEAVDMSRQTPLIIACSKGYTAIVERLLAAGANVEAVDMSRQTPLIIAVEGGYTAIVERLLAAGANVDAQTNKGDTPLILAASHGNKAIVELLLAAGADVNKENNGGKTAKQLAAEKGHADIVKLLSPQQKWKGFSRSDIENLNSIFETEGVGGDPPRSINTSCCPVCFKVVAHGRASQFEVTRSAACRYMSHNCSTSGGHYHEELYDKYKTPEGNITWCTICGRICTGHRHHKLVLAKDPKSELLPSGDPFGSEAACVADGGGGLIEKLARYRRLREVALDLQDEIDKISFEDAVNGLIEETWNAPLFRKFGLSKMMETKKFTNIPSEKFPIYRNNNNVVPDVPWPFQGRPAMMSQIGPAEEGNMNLFSYNLIPIAIQLKHRMENGEIVLHDKIGIYSLFEDGTAFSVYTDPGNEKFGKCFFEGCSAILYPGELQYILDNYNHPESLSAEKRAEYQAKINVYKQRFNESYKFKAAFKARVDADVVAAAALPAGGAGAGAGQGGGRSTRRTRRFRHQQRHQSHHRKQ